MRASLSDIIVARAFDPFYTEAGKHDKRKIGMGPPFVKQGGVLTHYKILKIPPCAPKPFFDILSNRSPEKAGLCYLTIGA